METLSSLQARDWIAIGSLLFTIFAFGVTQYLSARSQRKTRELAVRTYFSFSRIERNIDLTTKEKGVEKGRILTVGDYKVFKDALINNKKINGVNPDKISYLQIQNLGPSYALDCRIKVKSVGGNESDLWETKAYLSIINKDEFIYIPLNSAKYYPFYKTLEVEITYKTQAGESLSIYQSNDNPKHVLYKISTYGNKSELLSFQTEKSSGNWVGEESSI